MRARALLGAGSALFFLSGAAGLAYEVIWFKRLSHIWGNSALAAASVLASFLLGLGLGAALLGRLADRVRSPLRWYGACEIAIAALALLIPYEIRLLETTGAALYTLLSGYPLAGSLLRVGLTFLVLGPPCALMGGTFPLLVRQFTAGHGTLRESTGLLYAANTLGGAAGVYLTGFHLLPALGIPWTNGLAVAANLGAGAAALWLSRFAEAGTARGGRSAAPPERALPETPGGPRRWIFLAACLAGCASLLLEIAWTRQLALILGGSTYAFTAMLFSVIAGIGLGSLIFHAWLRRRGRLDRLQALVALAILATTVLGQALIEPLTLLVGVAGNLRGSPIWNSAICFSTGMALEFLPSLGMGILLPLYAALAETSVGDAGRTAGRICAWNTLGTILGSLGGALVLLPGPGSAACAATALALYLAAVILLLPSTGRAGRLEVVASSVLGAGMVLLATRGPDPLLTNAGLFLYGRDSLQGALNLRPLFFREGASASVFVTEREGTISLRVNGKVDASTSADMSMQLGLAYFPRFLRPAAREVLVIGFGSGTTSGASLLFPETRVTCVEIEPAVVEASANFREVNHQPFQTPRFSVVLNDGRSHLQGVRERYDLILSEPSNPWLAGVSSLFTEEFYRAARLRLAPGGLLAQWIQAYALAPADYALVVRTVRRVFPHGALLRISDGDTILLAGMEPVEPAGEVLEQAQALVDAAPDARADLEKHFGQSSVRSLLLSRLVLGDEGLEKLLRSNGGDRINTDLNLRLEFDAPLRLFDQSLSPRAVQKTILAAADTLRVSERWQRWGCTREQLPALKELLKLFADAGEWTPALKLIEFGLSIEPREPHLLSARFMGALPGDGEKFDRDFAEVLALSPVEAARISVWLHFSKDYARAVKVLKRILEVQPESATLWVNLAAAYRASGEEEPAREALRKALSLDPFSTFVQTQAGKDGQ